MNEGRTARPFLHEVALTLLPVVIVGAFGGLLLFQDRHFFWHDDYQTYQLACFRDVARSWSEGEFPLLSPYSWQCSALAAEYQCGVFSVFLTGLVLVLFGLELPLPLAAAALSITHLAVLAAGAFRLARHRGLTADLSLLAALVAALNGWIFLWGGIIWFPALASFAWLPWFWWALERALGRPRGPARFVPAALFLYLLVTAGWPFTVLMAGLLTAWLALQTWCSGGRLRALWPAPVAWGVGLGLSAPAWLMLVEYSAHTARAQTPALLAHEWVVPLAGLAGLIFPPVVVTWETFGRAVKPHVCAELAGGLVPVVILGTALAWQGRLFLQRLRWELGLCGLALLLALLPGFGNFRWSFRWLPFFFLALGLAAAQALAIWRERFSEAAAPNLGVRCAFVVLIGWALATLLRSEPAGLVRSQAVLLALLALVWVLAESRLAPAATLRAWLPAFLVAVSCWFFYERANSYLEVPTWPLEEHVRRPPRLEPGVQHLSVHTWADMLDEMGRGAGVGLFPGNAPLYSGLRFANGYSPLRPRGLTEVFDFGFHGYLGPAAGERLLVQETGPDGLLQLMAVDGLIVSDHFEPHWSTVEASGWRLEALVQGGGLFYRLGPPSPRVRAIEQVETTSNRAAALDLLTRPREAPVPLVLLRPDETVEPQRLRFAPAEVRPVEETRCRVTVDVDRSSSGDESLVVFARPWLPGYRATLDGRPVPVELLNLTMPAVRVPVGGRLVLEYRPRSLMLGVYLAAGAGAVVLLALLLNGLRRFPPHAAEKEVPRSPAAPHCSAPHTC